MPAVFNRIFSQTKPKMAYLDIFINKGQLLQLWDDMDHSGT